MLYLGATVWDVARRRKMRGYLAGMDRVLEDRRPNKDGRAVCISARRFPGLGWTRKSRIKGEIQWNSNT